jgi:WD40 repeat protein
LAAVAAIALWQRGQARLQRDLSVAQRLTDLSNIALAKAPSEAVLLAVEAAKVTPEPTSAALQALRNALTELEGIPLRSEISNARAIAPNGGLVAQEQRFNFKLAVRDIGAWNSVRVLPQTGNHYAVRFSESRQLVAVDYDAAVNYWDLTGSSPIRIELRAADDARNVQTLTDSYEGLRPRLAISPSGMNVAASAAHQTLNVWLRISPTTFRPVALSLGGVVTALAISDPSSDGQTTVAVATNAESASRISLIRISATGGFTTREIGLFGDGALEALALAPEWVFAGDAAGNVLAVQLPLGQTSRTTRLTTHHASVTGFVVRGPYLVSAGADGFVHVLENRLGAYKLLRRFHVHDAPIRAIALQPDGMIQTLSDDGELRAVHVDGNQLHPTRLYDGAVTGGDRGDGAERPLAFASDDRLLAVANAAFVDLWDLAELRQGARKIGPFAATQVALTFGPQNESLITAGRDGALQITDISQGHRTLLGTFPGVGQLAFRPSSNTVVAASSDAVASFKIGASIERKEIVRVDRTKNAVADFVKIDKTGRWIFRNESIYEVDEPSKPKWSLQHPGGPGGLSVSPRGEWAVMAAHLWDLRQESARPSPIRPTIALAVGGVPPYDFDDSGALLLSFAFGTGVDRPPKLVLSRIYSNPVRDEGTVLGDLPLASEVRLSPTNKWVAAVGRDGAISMWPLRFEDLYAMALTVVKRNMSTSEWHRAWPNLPYRPTFPEVPVSASIITELIAQARSLGGDQTTLYQSVTKWAIDLANPVISREVCLRGADAGAAKIVLPACLAAESLSHRNPIVSDTVGIALANAGDRQGAIERFEYFVSWAAQRPSLQKRLDLRRKWIAELRRGGIQDNQMFVPALSEGWWNDDWPPEEY